MSVSDVLNRTGPRKLLALDGGGIRGMLTIEILAKIESELQKALSRDDDFVLADYFDYIAGTSTGAIIATCLSLGMRVKEIRAFYIENGPAMFNKARWVHQFRHKYEDKNLAQKLQDVIAQKTDEPLAALGTDKLKTLLLLVLRNGTTDSPWPISNNPMAKYNDRDRRDSNMNLPLWQLVRASTAVPTFFPPEVVNVGNSDFIFVDGGVTVYNNPAFQLFLMATLEPYYLNWPTGEDQMLLVSIGTGRNPRANASLQPGEMNLIYNASSIPSALMLAAQNEQDLLCRVFGKCLVGDMINREVGDMIDKRGPMDSKLFTYMRYNIELSSAGLDKMGLSHIQPEDVQATDSIEHIKELQKLGTAVADRNVSIEHFAKFL
jgi:patatin-like phospholipase/acyl hydrolase